MIAKQKVLFSWAIHSPDEQLRKLVLLQPPTVSPDGIRFDPKERPGVANLVQTV